MTRVTIMEVDQTDDHAAERPRPKVGRLPVTLRLLNETETPDAQEGWAIENRKSDTQFMMLLVTLFIIVNLTLVALLNHKDKTSTAAPAAVAAEHHDAVAAPLPAAPAAPAPALKAELPATPAPAPVAVAPVPAPAYVTPNTSTTTRTTSAPYQAVTVSEHAATSAPATPTPDNLTVVHAQNPVTPVTASPELAPAAGTPAMQSPDKAKQDLLSVINKD